MVEDYGYVGLARGWGYVCGFGRRFSCVVRESGARVKDEDGYIIWHEVGLPSSSSTSTR